MTQNDSLWNHYNHYEAVVVPKPESLFSGSNYKSGSEIILPSPLLVLDLLVSIHWDLKNRIVQMFLSILKVKTLVLSLSN